MSKQYERMGRECKKIRPIKKVSTKGRFDPFLMYNKYIENKLHYDL